MATNGEPPAKKQKMQNEKVSTAALVSGFTKRHSVISLYHPEMVRVTVSDEALPNPLKMIFAIPKALICSRSEYFDKLFQNAFTEGREGAVELKDVLTRTFRCFIGWLYCHQIFLEDINNTLLQPPLVEKAEEDPETQSSVSHGTTHSPKATLGSSSQASAEMTELANAELSVLSEQTETSIFGTAPGIDVGGQGHSQQPVSTASAVASTTTAKASKCDLNDPVTWPWQWLFKLYIFADKYSTRDFRMEVFTVIQTKFYTVKPRPYQVPPYSAAALAAENLPSSSPLFRFLADIFGIHTSIGSSSAPDASRQAGGFSKLPCSFVAACLVALKRHQSARECRACATKTSHSGIRDHTSIDYPSMRLRDPCSYHEHGEDSEEAARCAAQWEARKAQFEKPQEQAKESEDGR